MAMAIHSSGQRTVSADVRRRRPAPEMQDGEPAEARSWSHQGHGHGACEVSMGGAHARAVMRDPRAPASPLIQARACSSSIQEKGPPAVAPPGTILGNKGGSTLLKD